MKEQLINTLYTRKQSNIAADDVQLDLNAVLADISGVNQAISYGLFSVAQLKTNIGKKQEQIFAYSDLFLFF
jgi:hypothetical protein